MKAHAKVDRIIRDLGPCTNYLKNKRWCLVYTEQNRRIMLDELCSIIKSVMGYEADLKRMVNIQHNYSQLEYSF